MPDLPPPATLDYVRASARFLNLPLDEERIARVAVHLERTRHMVADLQALPLDVDVEVVGADIGDQHETELGRLHGLVYDSDTHELDVIFDSGEHHVFAIMQVWVLEEPEGFLRALQVRRPDGNQEIIRFAQAPLPAVPPQESRESREPRDSARPSA